MARHGAARLTARRLDLHQRELRPGAIDRPRDPAARTVAARNPGRATWPFRDDLAAARPGGHGGPGSLRDQLRPIFVYGSENMDREAIGDYGITVTRPPLRNRCPGARWE